MSNLSSFEEQLALHGKIIYTNVGDSMMPLIKQGRDVLVIETPKAPLKVGDVPLYKRDTGKYVLHRIIAKRKNGYYICGDNRAWVEKGITDRHVIGVLTGIIRDGKELPISKAEGGFYKFYMCRLFPIKYVLVRIRLLFSRKRRK